MTAGTRALSPEELKVPKQNSSNYPIESEGGPNGANDGREEWGKGGGSNEQRGVEGNLTHITR